MSGLPTCPVCGVDLPAGASPGFCPKCLLLQARGDGQGARVPPANDSAPSTLPHFGGYELLERVGQGGMGIVYRARQISLDRIVALKVLPHGALAAKEQVLRFRAEAAAAGSLQHPNIVAIHEVGLCEDRHYLVMDFVEGQTLAELVRAGPLPPRRAARYLQTIAEAVHHAHEHGILHRDLKPSNVLIDAADQPRITDFGLAKRLGSGADLTLSGQVLGSPHYMSPEQATGQHRQVGRRSDVYALGAILYHLLTGRPPFAGETLADILTQVANDEPLRPRQLNPAVPADLETLCLKCLEKEMLRRYPTALALAEELGRFLRGEPIAARPVGVADKTWRWCRRRPVRAALIAALVASAALGTGGVIWEWRQAERARQDAVEKLWQSLLAQAQANRWSGRAGRRFAGLEAIRQAAAIRPTLELRNEAIACLALADARVQSQLPLDGGAKSLEVAYDASFERYARAYEDSSIRICRVEDNAELARLPGRGRIQTCRLLFSPRGQFLAHGGSAGANSMSSIWDASRGRLLFTVPFMPRSLSFAPDEQQIALAESEGTIHFHELATGNEVDTLPTPGGVNHIAYDPTGRRMAISPARSPSVLVLDLESRSVCASLTNAGSVGLMAWSPDGSVLACPSSDERVHLWHVATGERKTLEGHVGEVKGALFNHVGDMLVSFGWDNTTWFWDPKLGLPLVSQSGSWLPNGFDLADRRLGFGAGSLASSEFGLWEVAPARECRRLGRISRVWDGEFTADGRVLASASSDGVRLWQVPLNRLLAYLPVAEARSVIWHPNHTNLITSSSSGVQVWPILFSRNATEVKVGPARQVSALGRELGRLTADGHVVVVAAVGNADLAAFDLERPNQYRLINGHRGAAFVSMSPGGKWFATGTWFGTAVKVWDTATWQPLKELAVKGSARCAFTPDAKWLMTGSMEEYCLWRVGSWEARLRIPRDNGGALYGALALSPNARLAALLVGHNRGVKLVSIPDGHELAALDTGEPLCFSSDGGQLATVGDDRRALLVWDLRLIRDQLRALKLDWD